MCKSDWFSGLIAAGSDCERRMGDIWRPLRPAVGKSDPICALTRVWHCWRAWDLSDYRQYGKTTPFQGGCVPDRPLMAQERCVTESHVYRIVYGIVEMNVKPVNQTVLLSRFVSESVLETRLLPCCFFVSRSWIRGTVRNNRMLEVCQSHTKQMLLWKVPSYVHVAQRW